VEGIRSLLGHALEALWVFVLSLLFSFLILWDMPALWMEISFIQKTRLAPFYNQTKETIVTFAHVLGRVFQAQLMIAIVNTILTLIGLAILRLPDVMFLSIIVFFASFVPVLGVFVSTAPMALLAFNIGGFPRFLGVIVMIMIIHFIETYFLNPHIYGARMKINPVLVLVILLIGHHFFHVWGVLLGVPVFYYISRYAIRYPKDRPPLEPDEQKASRKKKRKPQARAEKKRIAAT
jgi:predicted PurR-regulated permease PerM